MVKIEYRTVLDFSLYTSPSIFFRFPTPTLLFFLSWSILVVEEWKRQQFIDTQHGLLFSSLLCSCKLFRSQKCRSRFYVSLLLSLVHDSNLPFPIIIIIMHLSLPIPSLAYHAPLLFLLLFQNSSPRHHSILPTSSFSFPKQPPPAPPTPPITAVYSKLLSLQCYFAFGFPLTSTSIFTTNRSWS